MENSSCYTLIGSLADTETISEQQLSQELQSDDSRRKSDALKKLIRLMVNGEKFNNILMVVIRYVMPCHDNNVKKLLLLFWEVVPKCTPDGKLRQEMILVCDAYRRDLQHPNEFIRGATLRFLCKLKEPELLEPLLPAIRQCLENKHPYVRRNAVLAMATIYKNFDQLIPDAPEKIEQFLEQEQDSACKRNAFMMLLHADQDRALRYLTSCLDQVHTFGDILQLVIVELIYKVCHSNPSERSRFIRCVYSLLQSQSPSVRYEAAGTLVSLSSAPTAIKAVSQCYIELVLREGENNVKLIVLDRLTNLRQNHEKILQDQVMDIVRILGSSDFEVRRKTLDLCLDLITLRNVEEFINILKKELIRAAAISSDSQSNLISNSSSKSNNIRSVQQQEDRAYRYQLVKTIYLTCVRYPEMIAHVVPTICETLTYEEPSSGTQSSNSNSISSQIAASEEACHFLRESILRFPNLKSMFLEKLMEYFPNIPGAETQRHLLWILGEFCETSEEIHAFMTLMHQVLGNLPLVDEELKRISGQENNENDQQQKQSLLNVSDSNIGLTRKTLVTADGTYATQSALTSITTDNLSNATNYKRPSLQASLFIPDFFPAVVLSVALVKIFCRYRTQLHKQNLDLETSVKRENSFAAECQYMIASMIRLARSRLLPHSVNDDHVERMWFCLHALSHRDASVLNVFNVMCTKKLFELVESQELARKRTKDQSHVSGIGFENEKVIQVDQPIKFLQLSTVSDMGEFEDRFDLTLNQALGVSSQSASDSSVASSSSILSKVRQLTGFSDPIYAEAYVTVNQYDILLDILVVNQTNDTLQNLTLELTTMGDLKLVEKPQPLTLASQDFKNIKANIKVSSSENGVIYGNIVYDVRGSTGESTCIVLNDIHVDILEYITPATCTPTEFQRMWSEFEWENKVTVNTLITNLHVFLAHIIKHTNMRCLTPQEALMGDCDYLCATLYARSIFGEHVLTNLCLERGSGNQQAVVGHIRIRAKTQGMAVTMGEKMSAAQKINPESLETGTGKLDGILSRDVCDDNDSQSDECPGRDRRILSDNSINLNINSIPVAIEQNA